MSCTIRLTDVLFEKSLAGAECGVFFSGFIQFYLVVSTEKVEYGEDAGVAELIDDWFYERQWIGVFNGACVWRFVVDGCS